MTLPRIPQSNAPIMQPNGVLSWEWYRWLAELAVSIDDLTDKSTAAVLAPAEKTGNVLVADYIDFAQAPRVAGHENRAYWDTIDDTLALCHVGGEVVQQVGQELYFYVKNASAQVISNGMSVMTTGALGASGRMTVARAVADGSVTHHFMLGVATHEIPVNGFGFVTHFGLVRGFDTSGTPYGEVWADGDRLWFNPTTPGGLTNVQPTAPGNKMSVALVITAAPGGAGSIFVRMRKSSAISETQDVQLSAPATNDILTYNATTGIWANSNDATLDQLTTNTTKVKDNLVLSGTSGEGVKVDVTTPTFGWHDMLGQIYTRGVGATDPAWTAYRGTISAYLFQVNDVAWCTFHMPHDYVPGTDLHLHIHWSHISAAVVSGAATWSFDVSYAKGHNQAAFSAPITATVSQNASTTQYQHMIAEVQISNAGGDASHIDRALLEVDGLILVRATLTANTLNAATDVFGHMIDIHYQSTGCPTKNKAPSFYV